MPSEEVRKLLRVISPAQEEAEKEPAATGRFSLVKTIQSMWQGAKNAQIPTVAEVSDMHGRPSAVRVVERVLNSQLGQDPPAEKKIRHEYIKGEARLPATGHLPTTELEKLAELLAEANHNVVRMQATSRNPQAEQAQIAREGQELAEYLRTQLSQQQIADLHRLLDPHIRDKNFAAIHAITNSLLGDGRSVRMANPTELQVVTAAMTEVTAQERQAQVQQILSQDVKFKTHRR